MADVQVNDHGEDRDVEVVVRTDQVITDPNSELAVQVDDDPARLENALSVHKEDPPLVAAAKAAGTYKDDSAK